MESSSFFEKVEKIKMPFRILILVGTIALIAGLFIWFYHIPKTEEIAKTEIKVKKLNQELARAKKKAANKAKFEAEFKKVDLQFKEAMKILPNSREIPKLLRTITRLGNDANLTFLLFNPQKERAKNIFIEIPVSIRVRGKYHDVATFFDMVGRMDRIVNILNVSMKPGKSLSTNLITNCKAITYRLKPARKKPKKKRAKKK